MSNELQPVALRSSERVVVPVEKDAAKKNELNKQKTVLEAEQRGLQSSLLQLRTHQRELLLENEKLKRVLQYREKVRNGDIDDPEVRYGIELSDNKESKAISIP